MIEEKIFFENSKNYFTFYSLDSNIKPLVVIVPGGGYDHTSKREAKNVADFFMNLGFHACVLNYREELNSYPNPQEELAYVIDYFRDNTKKYNLNGKILNIGFSAGAHLVLSQAIYHNEFGKNSLSDGLVLCYPVVSSDKDIMHKSSFEYLLKDKYSEELLDKLSLEKHVSKELPDVFMWHTITDESVNCLNSIRLLEQFKLNGINCEYHLYPKGSHGMSLADDSMVDGGKNHKDSYINQWTVNLKNWLILKNWI